MHAIVYTLKCHIKIIQKVSDISKEISFKEEQFSFMDDIHTCIKDRHLTIDEQIPSNCFCSPFLRL